MREKTHSLPCCRAESQRLRESRAPTPCYHGTHVAPNEGMSRVLVAYAARSGRTRAIAEELAQRLRRRGHVVDVANARTGQLPPPQDYDAVILGSRIERGHHARELLAYVREHRSALDAMPTAFFSVSLAAAVPFKTHDPGGHLSRLVDDSGWLPDHAACFGRIGTVQAWKLADLVTVDLADAPPCELSPVYGPI
jgi:menaquinone-dependent protoporphyrinogen IX oxidase